MGRKVFISARVRSCASRAAKQEILPATRFRRGFDGAFLLRIAATSELGKEWHLHIRRNSDTLESFAVDRQIVHGQKQQTAIAHHHGTSEHERSRRARSYH